MNPQAKKYLIIETASSIFFNALLNLAAAYGIYHGHPRIPTTGPGSLVADTIGETSIAVFLSVLATLLISRHRRRRGQLPASGRDKAPSRAGNPYLRALVASVLFTVVCYSLAAWLLPRVFPDSVSFGTLTAFKTIYGGLLGLVATSLYILKSFDEYDAKAEAVTP